MNFQKLSYDNKLKALQYEDIPFNAIALSGLPEPFCKDYSNHSDPAYRNYKSWDTGGFQGIFIEQLGQLLSDDILKVKIITPKDPQSPYISFLYLKNKNIAGLHIENSGNFKAWMAIYFEKSYQGREKHKEDGLYTRQPELNPNAPFMLSFNNAGGHGLKSIHTGMRVDVKPFDDTGAYLHKNAPPQYNQEKIAREKQNYIKKYINTELPEHDQEKLLSLWQQLLPLDAFKCLEGIDFSSHYAEFKALSGFDFPVSIKTFYQVPNAGLELNGLKLLKPKEIIEEWKAWKVIYDDWMLADLTGNNHPDGRKTLGIYTTPYWVPFAATGGGNFIAMDFAPGSKGACGQIIAFGADEIKIRYLAENLTDFLQQIADGKEAWNNGF